MLLRRTGGAPQFKPEKTNVVVNAFPAFPLGVDAVRLQRVVSSMKRFGLLPKSTRFQVTSMVAG
jgi:hypothetical protein